MAVAGSRSRSRRSKRSNKSRRTASKQRGGGTSYWSFAPSSADATMNNPMAWKSSDSATGTDRLNPTTGAGLPGMSSMSSQRGGGGGTHYGFTGVMVDTPAGLVADGTIGGMRSIPTNCALPAQQLNVRGGELWSQAGGASPSAMPMPPMVPAGPSPTSMNIAAPVAAMVAETKGGKRSKSNSKKSKSKKSKSKSKKSKSKSKKSKSKSRR